MELTRRSFLAALGITAAAPMAAKAGLLLPPGQVYRLREYRLIHLNPVDADDAEWVEWAETVPGAPQYIVRRFLAFHGEDAFSEISAAIDAGERAVFNLHLQNSTLAMTAIPTGASLGWSEDVPLMVVDLTDVRISAQ